VQNWIAARTTECIAGLVDTDSDANDLYAVWELPSDGPWAPEFEDVFLEITLAHISDLNVPGGGPDICLGLSDNDTEVLTDESGTPFSITYDVELDEADGDLSGPVYGTGYVTGSDDFASLSTSCSDPYCSTASLSVPELGGVWAIDRMLLYVDGPLIVSNGTANETIADVRIELYKQALGDITLVGGTFFFTIPAGDAHFVVVGKSNDDVATLPVSNSTDITATYAGGVWSFDEFEIEYVDDASDTWTVTVGASDWL
jgi:hypothetical protein